ncbi:intradiol ring-cleavage dioxygenase [Noviherbaspirillum saxi]|uniref:Twin-arginine translocation pathway signal protein n=1 Tax=Noviherbaspirillum saxi TaxID=2320863 RepID=A0A3A3FKY7_9BURK|nr:intradiol ring-cleavage dioxygenase [Noviherbaspirillum saxi]RJF96153.1 twin-arginine translocation pathway signal protein [Noviherbaspirillum saxi]
MIFAANKNTNSQKAELDFSRRRALFLLGASLISASAKGASTADTRGMPGLPSCIVTPQQTEGPFFIDERLQRSDIRTDPYDGSVSVGTALALTLRVYAVGANRCAPIAGAMVDIWHCDANGHYSGVIDGTSIEKEKKFLRGFQITGRDGAVNFVTVYPGWYPGRAVHIHFKVRNNLNTRRANEFTSQLYFDESVTDQVHSSEVYARRGRRMVLNSRDGLFQRDQGSHLLLRPEKTTTAYVAAFDIGLRM